MSSGFVSGGTVDAPIERDDAWLSAQKEIEANRQRKLDEQARQSDGRSLYETLEANKGTYLPPQQIHQTTLITEKGRGFWGGFMGFYTDMG